MADRLYHDAALARFYDLDNDWSPDHGFCLDLAGSAASVLDLGCGTGRFGAAAAVAGKRVVGVDPAAAMIDIARRRPGGDKAEWIIGDARRLALGQVFDLVVLTGHAFQVFLTPQDRRAVLDTIAAHLAPGGRFIFDSRNPDLEEWREWTPALSERMIDDPDLGPVRAWNDVACDTRTGIVTYDTFYEATSDGRLFSARSQIAFPQRADIEAAIGAAGLAAGRWMGDWSGAAWSPAMPEIIPIGGRR